MYVDAIHKGDDIVVWVRDVDGTLERFDVPAPYYCYKPDPKGSLKSIFGDTVSKVEFDTRSEYNAFVERYTKLYESDISSVYKFLSDNFYGAEEADLNVSLFDIEADVDLSLGQGYPVPENPYGKVNSISLFDVRTQEYHMIVLPYKMDKVKKMKLTDPDHKVNTYLCHTEKQLFDTFIKVIEDIDVLSAWNGEKYDIPYLVQRACRVYGEAKGKTVLCRDGFSVKEREAVDDFGNEFIRYTLVGRVHLDYLQLYKKFTFGERSSYKLDNIAEAELGIKKLPYAGDLGTLWREDPQTFYDYSLHDSRLLKLLDEKLKFLELAKTMGRKGSILYNDVLGSIKYLEQTIRNYCHHDRETPVVLPSKDPDASRESFPGAFVMQTKPNAYGWSCSVDLASLYPSVIRSLNISPETHLFQCSMKHADFIKIAERSNELVEFYDTKTMEGFELPAWEVSDFIRENNFTISAWGAILSENQGIIPEVLDLWYTERKRTKGLAKEYALSGEKKKSEYFDMMQQLMKLNLNSLYGAISNPFSRFYNINLAASVTMSGQMVERYQCWAADQIVKQLKTGKTIEEVTV